MDYVGLFCLGAFVGTIASLGIKHVESLENGLTLLAAVLPAVLSGGVILIVERFRTSEAFGCYPMGLAVAALWAYSNVALNNIRSLDEDKNTLRATRFLGWAHLGAAALATFIAAAIVLVPAYLQIRTELELSMTDRVRALEERRRSATDRDTQSRRDQVELDSPVAGSDRDESEQVDQVSDSVPGRSPED